MPTESSHPSPNRVAAANLPGGNAPSKGYQVYFFSELKDRPICAGKIKDRIGRLSDLIFKMSDPYPEAVGLLIDHGWGRPAELVPWSHLLRIEDDAIFVRTPENSAPATPRGGGGFPRYEYQTGWILLDQHLMGQTILDMDGRRTEVVNDVHLLFSHARMILLHVDLSFNGFLRRWGLYRFFRQRDQFVNWKYVQPLSVADTSTETVTLSITRKQIREVPPEDLADALEALTGEEQKALFSALEPQTAAGALVEAEPRTQRQIIAELRQERARKVLSEMSVPQIAELFSALPHEDSSKMLRLLEPDEASRIRTVLRERKTLARMLIGGEYLAWPPESRVGEVLAAIRASGKTHGAISYIYVINPADGVLQGVVDLRELVLAPDDKSLTDCMTSPVVTADGDDTREDLAELFAKYHFRMVPVVDRQNRMLGVIRYNDIMKGFITRART